jgi:hypothetical protein
MLNVPITPPRVPLIDPRTGLIDRAWYLFFLSLNNAVVTVENVDVGPNADTLVASYDAALRALTQDVSTLPPAVQTLVGDDPAIDNGLLSTVAEMQKQIEGLQVLPQQLTQLLSRLEDVNATSPANGDKLIYNGTTGKWEQDSRSYLMLE